MRQKRKQEKEKKKSPLVVWIFAAVLFSFMLSLFLGQGGMLRLREMRAHADEMIVENHRLAIENKKLSNKIRELREDPATIEKIAREELHYVSPRDFVLLVSKPDSAQSR